MTLKQKGLSLGFRQCVGEAISKIQFGGVAAGFPEIAIGMGLERPIFDTQPSDPPKLSRVVGNQRQAQAAGVSRDEQVVRPNHGALPS